MGRWGGVRVGEYGIERCGKGSGDEQNGEGEGMGRDGVTCLSGVAQRN